MVRDGVARRGGRERQRWRCKNPDGSYHRFLGVVPRTRADAGFCLECDNHIAPFEGPASPWRFEYTVKEVADAFVQLGRGLSYTDTAVRARIQANIGRPTPAARPTCGQTVADWVADLVPVVAAPHRETSWSDAETVVLDSTEFMWTNPRTHVTMQLFAVLAAWGYPADGTPGRLWLLRASPRDDGPAWEQFLGELPGAPKSVVSDRDLAIIGAVKRHWSRQVPHQLCEHHLYENAMKALRKDQLANFGLALPTLLKSAFTSHSAWDAFAQAAAAMRAPETQKWVKHWDRRMRIQTARRASLPDHHSSGAVEGAITTVRQVLERRRFTFRNLTRMNLLLELVRLRINRQDDPRGYATLIRQHLEATGGAPARSYRSIVDPMVWDTTLGVWRKGSSLRA